MFQYRDAINKRQGNMVPPELSYPMTVRPDYSNTAEAQEKTLRSTL